MTIPKNLPNSKVKTFFYSIEFWIMRVYRMWPTKPQHKQKIVGIPLNLTNILLTLSGTSIDLSTFSSNHPVL